MSTSSNLQQTTNSVNQKETCSSTDWTCLFQNAYKNSQYNKFINYRFNPSTISTSYSGCVGTDEEGNRLIPPDGVCDPNNLTNSKPCKIDNNLHTPDTCKLNVSFIDSKKRFHAINVGQDLYAPGLLYNVYQGSMRDNYDDFFINNPRILFNGISTQFNNLGQLTLNTIVENVGNGGRWLGRGTDSHWFTIEWRGLFKAPANGKYTFSIESDDSGIMWIGDGANDPHFYGKNKNVFLDNAGGHGMRIITQNFQVNDASLYYPVRIRFEEWWGGYGCIIKVLDQQNKNNDIANSCFFHYSQPSFSTYYSLVRSRDNSNLYDCYLTNQDDNVEKSKGRQYLYRTVVDFTKYYGDNDGNPVGPKNTYYIAVGDDGSLQLYNAKKAIDFDKKEVRDGNHPEFLCRLYRLGDNYPNMNYWLNWDGNMNGDSDGANRFLSWQNMLNWDGKMTNPNVKLYYQIIDPSKLSKEDQPKELLEPGVFNLFASPDNYVYWPGNNLRARNILVHKDNPYNTKKLHYTMVGVSGNFKLRMDSQGALRMIYAVSACRPVQNNGEKVMYSEDQNSFAFYNVKGDPRTNQSFYYNQTDNTLNYIDKSAYKDMYKYRPDGQSQDYTEYENIYIPQRIKLDNNELKVEKTKEECQSLCNTTKDCKYYYWGKDQNRKNVCYVDSGKYPYEFTPSSDLSGSTADYISSHKSSLFVKEQTVYLDTQTVQTPDMMVTETNYANSYDGGNKLPIINYSSSGFKRIFDPANAKTYNDDNLKSIRDNEYNYYYGDVVFTDATGGANKVQNTLGSRNAPAGPETFIGYYGKEGFDNLNVPKSMSLSKLWMGTNLKEGYDNGGLSIQQGTLTANQSQGQKTADPTSSPYLPSYNTTGTSDSTDVVYTNTELITSQNENQWADFMPPKQKDISLVSSNTKNLVFFNHIYNIMVNVYIHLPLYKIEKYGDFIGCLNRGFGKKNYNNDASSPDGYHIIKTATEVGAGHDAFYYGDLDGVEQTTSTMPSALPQINNKPVALPFSDSFLYFSDPKYASTKMRQQYFKIKDPINWPQNHIKFSFYFKVSSNTPQWSRIFDFSNGQLADNIIVFIHRCTDQGYSKGGLGLGFICFGTDVYGTKEPYRAFYNHGAQYTLFENIQDKWHFCQWYLYKDDNFQNPIPGNPNKRGTRIIWFITLHTLENDGSVTMKFILLLDSTFSNYKNQIEKNAHNEYLKYIIDNTGPFSLPNFRGHQSSEAFIITPSQQNDDRAFYDTRNYVAGYDSIGIIYIVPKSGPYPGFEWPLRGEDLGETYANELGAGHTKTQWVFTPRFRLSFPTVATTQNYINASPWPWDQSIMGSIRDFKIVFNEGLWTAVSEFPSSFSWCVDSEHTRIRLASLPYYNEWPWLLRPLVSDNNKNTFSNSNLLTGCLSSKLNGNFDFSKIQKYDPDITNNLANFIYSQIIYNKNPEMLKRDLQNMPHTQQGFQNIEGFSTLLSSPLREGLPDVSRMIASANTLNNDNSYYENRLGQISNNSIDLKNNLVDYQINYNYITNAKNDMYDMSGNHLLYYQNKDTPSLRDTKISDNQEVIIQQNTVYTIGTITCASMILAAIILARQ